MKPILATALAGGTLALAGCVETASVPMSSPPFITTFDASVSNAAVSSCRAELDRTTDGIVQVVGTEFSQANSAVYLVVGANRAPWRCLVSNDGSKPSLMFMGDEGAL